MCRDFPAGNCKGAALEFLPTPKKKKIGIPNFEQFLQGKNSTSCSRCGFWGAKREIGVKNPSGWRAGDGKAEFQRIPGATRCHPSTAECPGNRCGKSWEQVFWEGSTSQGSVCRSHGDSRTGIQVRSCFPKPRSSQPHGMRSGSLFQNSFGIFSSSAFTPRGAVGIQIPANNSRGKEQQQNHRGTATKSPNIPDLEAWVGNSLPDPRNSSIRLGCDGIWQQIPAGMAFPWC